MDKQEVVEQKIEITPEMIEAGAGQIIEITPQMIEAGLSVLASWDQDAVSPQKIIEEIYRAIESGK